MYLNACQKYIAELLEEYGPLLKRQLLTMAKHKFQTVLPNLDGYIGQMCHYGDFEQYTLSNELVIAPKGAEPDFDVIRSVDVMLQFFPNVIQHRKSRGFITIRFFVSTPEHDKEISVIPVRAGMEQTVSDFAEDKFGCAKCEVVMFLPDSREQMKRLFPNCYYRFAILEKDGVKFFRPGE